MDEFSNFFIGLMASIGIMISMSIVIWVLFYTIPGKISSVVNKIRRSKDANRAERNKPKDKLVLKNKKF